jgi:sterol desaturase/sphingolipid hydroxylase (fatty acid hydroxylase superfamily)
VNLTVRPLAYVWTFPMYHRFHHTLAAVGGNKNFAGLFPIFDRVFGTYYLPHEKPTELGLDVNDCPKDMWGQMTHPFRKLVKHV